MMPATSMVKWPGGKGYFGEKFVSLFPRHLNYCEPYAGGLSVLLARDPDDESLWLPPHKGVSEVVNDLNRELTNFWTTLANKPLFDLFARLVSAVPFSSIEYAAAVAGLAKGCADNGYSLNGGNQVVRAAWFFIANRMSLAGRMKGFTGITKTRTRARMNNEVSAWLSAVDGLPAFHARLRRVLILPPQPAVAVIHKFDGPETFMYLDPPYVHSTRATTGEYGEFEMDDMRHRELLATITHPARRSKFMLSGYDCPLYREFLGGWRRLDFECANQASGAKEKRRMVESLWMNYDPPAGGPSHA